MPTPDSKSSGPTIQFAASWAKQLDASKPTLLDAASSIERSVHLENEPLDPINSPVDHALLSDAKGAAVDYLVVSTDDAEGWAGSGTLSAENRLAYIIKEEGGDFDAKFGRIVNFML